MRVDWKFHGVQTRAERPFNRKSETEADVVLCFRTASGQLRDVVIDRVDLLRLFEGVTERVAKELSRAAHNQEGK